MALPLKGDPRRPLHLAVRSMRVLAVLLFVMCGAAAIVAFFVGRARTVIIVEAIAATIYGLPAAANLVFSIYTKRQHYWAIIAAIVLTSTELVIALIGAVGAVGATLGGMRRQPNVGAAVICWIIVLALGQLLRHLIRALCAFHKMQADDQRGFEVLGVQPVQPMPQPEKPASPPDFTAM